MWMWVPKGNGLAALIILLGILVWPICIVFGIFMIIKSKEWKIKILGAVLALICIVYPLVTLGPSVKDAIIASKRDQKIERSYQNADNYIIDVVDMKAINTNEFEFSLIVTNNSLGVIIGSTSTMIVSNYYGYELLRTDMLANNIYCKPNTSEKYTFTVKTTNNVELFYTDFSYLNIQIILLEVDYNDRVENYKFDDYREVHIVDEVKLQAEYDKALSFQASKEYKKAWDIYCTLGSYEDSAKYRELCYQQMYGLDSD